MKADPAVFKDEGSVEDLLDEVRLVSSAMLNAGMDGSRKPEAVDSKICVV